MTRQDPPGAAAARLHFTEAELLLARADGPGAPPNAADLRASAAVHADLAVAAASGRFEADDTRSLVLAAASGSTNPAARAFADTFRLAEVAGQAVEAYATALQRRKAAS
jgi:hypothetical protein